MIYLDTCLVIYWVEEHSVFAPRIEQVVLKSPLIPLAISPLVMTEVLVMPYRQKHTALINRYETFFASGLTLPMPEPVFVHAARLRAAHPALKTPDALHLATAQYHGCTQFWTNDDRLQRVAGSYAVNVCAVLL